MTARVARRTRFAAVMTALGVAASLGAAPAALADPQEPADPPSPTVLVADAATAPASPETPTEIGPAAADPAAASAGPADGTALTAAAPAVAPADGIDHLPSPDSPPPGTSTEEPTEGGRVGYLRDLWHAVRTQDVTMTDALLLFTQRSLDSKAAPPGVPTTPRGQLGPADPALAGPDAQDPPLAEASGAETGEDPLIISDGPVESGAAEAPEAP